MIQVFSIGILSSVSFFYNSKQNGVFLDEINHYKSERILLLKIYANIVLDHPHCLQIYDTKGIGFPRVG